MIDQIEQNPGKQAVETAIANTAIHDCDDSTYEVHVSAATQHMLAQLRENFITGLNIYSLIESTILKYAESHATKEYLLVKSTKAYKQLSESTNKELVELRQLVEVLKKENDELRIELNALRDKDSGYVLKEAPNVEHSSEHTVTLSDEDVESIKGNGKVETIPSVTRADSVSDEQLYAWVNKDQYISRPIVSPTMALEPLVKHPNPNGAGNGVFVSTGKPDTRDTRRIRVTEYSKVADTKI